MIDTLHTWFVWTAAVVLLFSCSKGFPTRALAQEAEPRAKVVIVDTGLDQSKVPADVICKGAPYDLTGEGWKDKNGHGTNIAGIILKDLDPRKECLLPIKVYLGNYGDLGRLVEGLRLARQLEAAFVNISMGGNDPHLPERQAIEDLLNFGTEVIVCSGNDGRDLGRYCDYFPACYPMGTSRFWVVGASDFPGNYGGPTNAYMKGRNICALGTCMTGTSQATAAWTRSRLRATRPSRK